MRARMRFGGHQTEKALHDTAMHLSAMVLLDMPIAYHSTRERERERESRGGEREREKARGW